MITKINKNKDRLKRHKRVRFKVKGTAETPRLCVYRSTTHIYAQIIDDVKGNTLVTASTLDKEIKGTREGKDKKAQAYRKAVEDNISGCISGSGCYRANHTDNSWKDRHAAH